MIARDGDTADGKGQGVERTAAVFGKHGDAQDDGQPLGDVIAGASGWDGFKSLVAIATRLGL